MAKQVKQVKCKKCKLTYDKKKYECPYCHKKRFNPTGLIIFLIILVIAAGAVYYFYGDKVNEYIKGINTSNSQNGLIFKNLSVELAEGKENTYRIKFDIENKTGNSINKNYHIINLADRVRAEITKGDFSLWKYDYELIELKILPKEIYKAEYEIKIENEWKELEIYLCEINIEELELKESEEMKIFTFKNNIEINESETTDINIITE